MASPNYYAGIRDAQGQTYEPGLPSTLAGNDIQSLAQELARLQTSAGSWSNLVPQVASEAPRNPVRGMVRFAVAPWNPMGFGAGWVQYNGTAWVPWPNEIIGNFRVRGTTTLDGAVSAPGGITGNLTGNVTGNLTGSASLNVLKAGDTMTGDLIISKVEPELRLSKTLVTSTCRLRSMVNGASRWGINMASAGAETGGNAGSDFAIERWADNGSYLNDVVTISRATGNITLRGTTRVEADILTFRPWAPGTGVIFLNQAGSRFLFFNGSRYDLPGSRTYSQGFVYQANESWGLEAASWLLDGNVRFQVLASGNPDWQNVQYQTVHDPGVFAGARINVGGSVFDFRNNGVGYSFGGWTTFSDRRLKDNIRPITDAITRVKRITGCTYIRRDLSEIDGSKRRVAGLIAQDVRDALPEAVQIPDPKARPEGHETSTLPTLALDYNGVVALLVEANKELAARVEALEARLTGITVQASGTVTAPT